MATRRVEAVAPVAAALGAQAVPFEGVVATLHQYDIVLASTAAPEPVLRVRDVDAVRQRRAGRPLFLVDLALPRDIEPGVGELPDVYVYTLEDLGRIAEANLAARQAEVARLRLDLRARATDQWRECAKRAGGG
jgi:glutamyl-tRNA reductase